MAHNIMPLEQKPKLTLAIIGGGRWGRVTLSVLAKMQLPYHFVVVSNANYDEIESQLASFKPSLSTFNVVHTMAELFSRYEINAAVVVNSASAHFETARNLINKGKHVLIEKPIVLSSIEMKSLIEDARKNKVFIIPGLCYRFCSYVHHFAREIKNKANPSQFLFEWHDEKNELRYGQKKTHDKSINVVQDVMPHVWTILSIVFNPDMRIQSCRLSSNGDCAEISVLINDIRGTIVLNRNGRLRKRHLSVQLAAGKRLALDFTIEPGLITDEARAQSGDDHWNNQPSPLTQQLDHFFSTINNHTSDDAEINACLRSVKIVEDVLACVDKSMLMVEPER